MNDNDLERLVNNWLKPISDKLDYVTGNQEKSIDKNSQSISKQTEEMSSVKEAFLLVKAELDNHVKDHSDKEKKQRFQYEQVIGFACVVAAILVDKFI